MTESHYAYQVISQERALELLHHKTRIGNVDCPTIDVSSKKWRALLTGDEEKAIQDYWQTLPGSSSIYTTVLRLAVDREPAAQKATQ